MRKSSNFKLYLLLILVLPGCTTNYLYIGQLDVKDSASKNRKALIYWTKTSTWFQDKTSAIATLQTECGKPLQFTQEEKGIQYIGDPNTDMLDGQSEPVKRETVCGEIENKKSLVDISDGDLKVSIKCLPYSSWGSLKHYIGASNSPYKFVITSKKRKSISGDPFETPNLDCVQ